MNMHLITFSNDQYKNQQMTISRLAADAGVFGSVTPYTWNDIAETDFYQKNRDVLTRQRGCGYWLWKPYIILDKLSKIPDGDLVFYMDCGDIFTPGVVNHVIQLFQKHDYDCLLLPGVFTHSNWTKRDCFVLMDCDSSKYWSTIQLEAGINFWKNSKGAKDILNKWIMYGSDSRIITDDENTCGLDNLAGFIDHRHDQSILTNLSVKHELPSDKSIRNFVKCNV
jgi:hypothetical protein